MWDSLYLGQGFVKISGHDFLGVFLDLLNEAFGWPTSHAAMNSTSIASGELTGYVTEIISEWKLLIKVGTAEYMYSL